MNKLEAVIPINKDSDEGKQFYKELDEKLKSLTFEELLEISLQEDDFLSIKVKKELEDA